MTFEWKLKFNAQITFFWVKCTCFKHQYQTIYFRGLPVGETKTAIGLMSGTSLDGIDIALIKSDGHSRVERGPSMSISYDAAFTNRLKDALEIAKRIRNRNERPDIIREIERELTHRHGAAVSDFLKINGLASADIDVIGFHGQTVLHRPDEELTVQIGDGNLLARLTQIRTIYDMRANDMVHGGQGAPLVPVYHAALSVGLDGLAGKAIVFVNIGGISNLTFIGSTGEIIAYDSGPGNTLIDQWVSTHAGISYDNGGAIASAGSVLLPLASRYLEDGFFFGHKRRSLDRNDFLPPASHEASLADGARTLAFVSAAAIMQSARHLPEKPALLIICGGGRLNKVIMADLASMLEARVVMAEELGLNGDSMEAEAWAYLAIRSLKGLALTFPVTTGVRMPVSGGVLTKG